MSNQALDTLRKNDQFFRDMQEYSAITAIGTTALRNQGAKGVIAAAQRHLAGIDLGVFNVLCESDFLKALDIRTEKLREALPRGARNWGAARKALNLFLRDVCYNRFLFYQLTPTLEEEWLEIPLDSLVATWLKRRGKRGQLPHWPGLIELSPSVSFKFQTSAKQIANVEGISRIHLDMRIWTVERAKVGNKQ